MKSIEAQSPPEGRYDLLDECLGSGVFGRVYLALDKTNNCKLAIKIMKVDKETSDFVHNEMRIVQKIKQNANLVDIYDTYRLDDEVWITMEYCEGGSVIELIRGLQAKNRRLNEEHIAYILHETVQALIYLHNLKIIHGDLKASNLLVSQSGEIKLCDFNLSKLEFGEECCGCPAWMAPEVASRQKFDIRADIWSLGITSIELGDAKAPYQNMNATRALFQIATNPPPTLQWPSNWTTNYNDFISECLVKQFENRPYALEVAEHPFFGEIPNNSYYLGLEIKSLISDLTGNETVRQPDGVVVGNKIKKHVGDQFEALTVEDFASLETISEETILNELEKRLKRGDFQTYIGDMLLVLNPNQPMSVYGGEIHAKYQLKSRSDNAPHIYGIADNAYQNALHHAAPQRIVLAGETSSGKTSNFLHLVDHLLFLGQNPNVSASRIKNAIKLVHSFTHASTPFNAYSTRSLLRTTIIFGKTGRVTAANFSVNLLEKWRVSSVDMSQGNFHFLYYFYDGLSSDKLEKFRLNNSRDYRYLRIAEGDQEGPRSNVEKNKEKYNKLLGILQELDFSEEQIELIHVVLAAILNLGQVRVIEDNEAVAQIESYEILEAIAQLLGVNPKRFKWALINYCQLNSGTAIKKRKTCEEIRDSRDVLANNLYCKLVDYIVAVLNHKLSLGKAIFGEKYSIKILDYFGFECCSRNNLEQLLINTLNEQLQYHFLQRMFSWEIIDITGEDIEFKPLDFYDNKDCLDQLMGKPEGVLTFIDDSSKKNVSSKFILDYIQNLDSEKIQVKNHQEFSVAHYTGTVSYNIRDLPDKNRDFLAPELIETLRQSSNLLITLLFKNKLDKTGNLIVQFDQSKPTKPFSFNSKKLASEHQYSQIKRMRTTISIYRQISLELLRELSTGSGSGDTHFVRCIQPNLKKSGEDFHKNLVKQQIRALAIVETAKVRKLGYSCRISFPEFLRRYQFLAFDFEETVEMTRDNCRLLLIRLKLEDWAIGKSKVFLKYYNEEYLARLYEVQVKKIVKIQSILRGFLTKCRLQKEVKQEQEECIEKIKRSQSIMTEEEAAEIIQKAYRRCTLKRFHAEYLEEYPELDDKESDFIKPFVKKWKCKSMFQVLMMYRAHKLTEFFNFCQQVHWYNLNTFHGLKEISSKVNGDSVDKKAQVTQWLGETKTKPMKLLFRLDEIPYYNTSNLTQNITGTFTEQEESWDSPYRWKESKAPELKRKLHRLTPTQSIDYTRDSEDSITEPPELQPEKVASQPKTPPENFNHTKPANKDFDYIRPTTNRPKLPQVHPITELQNIVRRASITNEDDPPFNFKGMLRKTNFKRDSIKQIAEEKPAYRLRKIEAVQNGLNEEANVRFEFGPGLVMIGKETDL